MILERTEHNLGVQADIPDLQGYVICCFFCTAPRQWTKAEIIKGKVLVSKYISPYRPTLSLAFCLLPSVCAEICVKATPAFSPFLLFHSSRHILP